MRTAKKRASTKKAAEKKASGKKSVSEQRSKVNDLRDELRAFFGFNRFTETEIWRRDGVRIPVFANEFWTAKQRDGHSLQEISYRACYKPQLPEFFIQRLTAPGDRVYDPFMGRGTTLIEAQLNGCQALGNDANSLAAYLTGPRLNPPVLESIGKRLEEVELKAEGPLEEELLVFFAPETLAELEGWRGYFRRRLAEGSFDPVDGWLRMVGCNRLTGHSRGFFSVYTLPPNQATSVVAQRKINEKRGQTPEYRDTKQLILKKSKQLLKDPVPWQYHRQDAVLLTESAESTPQIEDDSIALVVTSPPFLDTVNYVQDNWLRAWFCDVVLDRDRIWQLRSLKDWMERMQAVFVELRRVLRPDGWIAFEVGEIRAGTVELETAVVHTAKSAGLIPDCIMINTQEFTKTANCWGVDNNKRGTNSNRIVLLRKDPDMPSGAARRM